MDTMIDGPAHDPLHLRVSDSKKLQLISRYFRKWKEKVTLKYTLLRETVGRGTSLFRSVPLLCNGLKSSLKGYFICSLKSI